MPPDLQAKTGQLLDQFIELVSAIATSKQVRRAVIRSLLGCNVAVILDDAHVSVAAEKSSGLPSTTNLDERGKRFTLQSLYEAAKWDLGYGDPFVFQIPLALLDKHPDERAFQLQAIAEAHVASEVNRVTRELNMVQVNPVFGPVSYAIDPRLTFVLMPFDEDLTQIYNTIVKPMVESDEFGLVCKRADDIKSNKAIIQDIWKAICEARLIIADMTRLNPNVMYELGIAHTVGKDTILIYQKEQQEMRFPFDLSYIRRIEYVNDATGGKRLETELKETIRSLLGTVIDTSLQAT